ncbi:MAG: bifunctional pyr operon transcriptional regulator/uracil phosphoribosyltransferase [Massilia sp.]|jgi:pyrimidine operon attenuation protein/uracil phosphoribosyltransferase|nr:bifunctional pyr operon transcriptional regulator/uracil phosphoribosyltransferase [Massilia sp.]
MPTSVKQFDAEALYRDLLEQVRAGLSDVTNAANAANAADVAIVGIHSGGAWLAERLAADLGPEFGSQLGGRLGFIDVSFYRDDYAKKGLHPDVKPTQIGFDVDRATILLVDDVLYTGRTTRAAINVLFDYGRPARIMLAALADRGGRELPVAADFVAAHVPLEPTQALVLARGADGTLSLTIEEDHA